MGKGMGRGTGFKGGEGGVRSGRAVPAREEYYFDGEVWVVLFATTVSMDFG